LQGEGVLAGVAADLKSPGLQRAPLLAAADGAMGFWAAVEEVSPATQGERYGATRSDNEHIALPNRGRSHAQADLEPFCMAVTRAGVTPRSIVSR
jgi:putative transposase